MRKAFLLLLLSVMFLASCGNKEKFDNNVYEGYYATLYTYKLSGLIASNTVQTWNSAVFDGGGDFNSALERIYKGYKEQGIIDTLDHYKNRMDSITHEMADPPSDRKELYDDYINFVGETTTLYNLAIKPTGSLRTYSPTVNQQIATVERLNREFQMKYSKYIKKEE